MVAQLDCAGLGVLASSPIIQTLTEQAGHGPASSGLRTGGSFTSYWKSLLGVATGRVTSPESWGFLSRKPCNQKVYSLILECLTHSQSQYHLLQEALLENTPAPQFSGLSYNYSLMLTMGLSLNIDPFLHGGVSVQVASHPDDRREPSSVVDNTNSHP